MLMSSLDNICYQQLDINSYLKYNEYVIRFYPYFFANVYKERAN